MNQHFSRREFVKRSALASAAATMASGLALGCRGRTRLAHAAAGENSRRFIWA